MNIDKGGMKIYVCNVCKKAKLETEYPVTARGGNGA